MEPKKCVAISEENQIFPGPPKCAARVAIIMIVSRVVHCLLSDSLSDYCRSKQARYASTTLSGSGHLGVAVRSCQQEKMLVQLVNL